MQWAQELWTLVTAQFLVSNLLGVLEVVERAFADLGTAEGRFVVVGTAIGLVNKDFEMLVGAVEG